MNHDNYDKDILKALKSIATSLKSIDSVLHKNTNNKQYDTENINTTDNIKDDLRKLYSE